MALVDSIVTVETVFRVLLGYAVGGHAVRTGSARSPCAHTAGFGSCGRFGGARNLAAGLDTGSVTWPTEARPGRWSQGARH